MGPNETCQIGRAHPDIVVRTGYSCVCTPQSDPIWLSCNAHVPQLTARAFDPDVEQHKCTIRKSWKQRDEETTQHKALNRDLLAFLNQWRGAICLTCCQFAQDQLCFLIVWSVKLDPTLTSWKQHVATWSKWRILWFSWSWWWRRRFLPIKTESIGKRILSQKWLLFDWNPGRKTTVTGFPLVVFILERGQKSS